MKVYSFLYIEGHKILIYKDSVEKKLRLVFVNGLAVSASFSLVYIYIIVLKMLFYIIAANESVLLRHVLIYEKKMHARKKKNSQNV